MYRYRDRERAYARTRAFKNYREKAVLDRLDAVRRRIINRAPVAILFVAVYLLLQMTASIANEHLSPPKSCVVVDLARAPLDQAAVYSIASGWFLFGCRSIIVDYHRDLFIHFSKTRCVEGVAL